MKKQKIVCALLVLMMLVSVTVGCGNSNNGGNDGEPESITFRMASDAAVDSLTSDINRQACDLIAERTEGRVVVDYYPAGQLGSYTQVFEELILGTVDMGQLTIPDHIDKNLTINYMPFYSTTYEQIKVLFAPDAYITQIYQDIVSQHGVRFLGWSISGFHGWGSVTEVKSIKEPGVTKGVKMRVPPLVAHSTFTKEYGFECVTIPWAEIPTSMQTGIIQAFTGGNAFHNYNLVGEIINYYYDLRQTLESTSFVISEKSFQKLSEEDQKIVTDVIAEMSALTIEEAEAFQNEYIEKLQTDHDIEVVTFTDEEKAEITKWTRDVVWAKLEAEAYEKKYMDGLRAELEKYGY